MMSDRERARFIKTTFYVAMSNGVKAPATCEWTLEIAERGTPLW